MTTPIEGPTHELFGYRVVARFPDHWLFLPIRMAPQRDGMTVLRELLAEDTVGLASVEVPVIAHPRVTEHGIEHVDAHMRKVEVKGFDSRFAARALPLDHPRWRERRWFHVTNDPEFHPDAEHHAFFGEDDVGGAGVLHVDTDPSTWFGLEREYVAELRLADDAVPMRDYIVTDGESYILNFDKVEVVRVTPIDEFELDGVPDDLSKVVSPPQIKRLDQFGEKAREGLDKYIADNDIDMDGIADDILTGFENPDLIDKGERWYREEFNKNAHKLAEEFDVPVETAAAVIAITSARTKWRYTDAKTARTIYKNLDVARNFLRLWRDGAFDGMSSEEAAKTVRTGYIPNKGFGQNVIGLLKGELTIDEAVTGAKRRSFYDNGMFPDTSMSITNDVWMSVYLANHSSMSEKTAQAVLSGDGPLYLQEEGVHAKPGYLILSEAIMRAHEQAIERGLVPSTWLPHQTQALAWVKMVDKPPRKDAGK